MISPEILPLFVLKGVAFKNNSDGYSEMVNIAGEIHYYCFKL